MKIIKRPDGTRIFISDQNTAEFIMVELVSKWGSSNFYQKKQFKL
jgi:hypothetical protein